MRADSLGFPITLDVDGAAVLVVGDSDDADAERKRRLLEEAGAQVRQVAPAHFRDEDCDGARLVLLTRRDRAIATRVAAAARARGALVWCSDEPAACDLAMPAIARLGPLTIAIATSGGSPGLASRLRVRFEEALGETFARFVTALGERRPTQDVAARRADLDGFSLDVRVGYPDWFTKT
jgi:siroheme synthase (precorrin-2 oxidase/ferrochelatase)